MSGAALGLASAFTATAIMRSQTRAEVYAGLTWQTLAVAALVCVDHRYLKSQGVPVSSLKACFPVDGDTYDVPAIMRLVLAPGVGEALTALDRARRRRPRMQRRSRRRTHQRRRQRTYTPQRPRPRETRADPERAPAMAGAASREIGAPAASSST